MTVLNVLREVLDDQVVGHDEVKQALLLALLCREHVYLEGPPGSAKTRVAELVAQASGLRFFFHQLHRDTRLPELVGDVVLERRETDDGALRIHQRIEPGGLLRAEVAVLDDISRAPGEALNVLLRLLNERRFGDEDLPLVTAIATSNPHRDEYYNEPLDPANLDRFALQLEVGSLLADDALAARELIDRYADGRVDELARVEPRIEPAALESLQQQLPAVLVPEPVRSALLGFLRILVREEGCDETNSLLTDRSFLVKAQKILRGRALLAGRDRVEPGDLEVLAWMTTFRVPSEVQARIPDLIARVVG